MGNCLSYRLKIVHEQDSNLPENVTRFSYKSLEKATNNFSTFVDTDGYSSSYEGTLEDGCKVIVKVFKTVNRNNIDFNLVVKIMSGVKHKNVVELLGFCLEGHHKMLVQEFVGNYRLLDLLISESRVTTLELPWHRRASICHGIARAIEYLHHGISPSLVVDCDVRPVNVLIDSSFNPKILNYDFAYLIEDDKSHDYLRKRRWWEEVDVYPFGISMLEIISGRRNAVFVQDSERISLVDQAWELRESGRILDIVDSTLSEFSEDQVIRFVTTALFCVQPQNSDQPFLR